MKTQAIVSLITILILTKLHGQDIWTGPSISFTKPRGADWTLVEYQDRITDNVWITRSEDKGIFNIKAETSYIQLNSPSDTEWAFGTTADIGTLVFQDWATAIDRNPPDAINKNMVLHLISDAVYIDIMFTSWDIRTGGGFSYERSTNSLLNLEDFKSDKNIIIFPNPATTSINVSGIGNQEKFVIYNNLGIKIMEGNISNNETLNISRLDFGIYLLCFKNKKTIKIAVLN